MKKVFIFLFALVALAACKKDADNVKPADPVAAVAGTYTLSSFSYVVGGEDVVKYSKLPVTQQGVTISALAVVEKVSDTNASLVLTLKATGDPDQELDLGDYPIKADGSGYGIYSSGGSQIGKINGSNLEFAASGTSDSKSVEIRFTGKK